MFLLLSLRFGRGGDAKRRTDDAPSVRENINPRAAFDVGLRYVFCFSL